MPGESARLGAAAFELFNEGRLDEMWEITDPEVVMATDPLWPGGGRYVGRDAFQRFMAQFLEAFKGIEFEHLNEPEELGDAAVLHGRWVGAGAASGIEATSVPFWVVFLARNGLIVESHFFFDEAVARERARELG